MDLINPKGKYNRKEKRKKAKGITVWTISPSYPYDKTAKNYFAKRFSKMISDLLHQRNHGRSCHNCVKRTLNDDSYNKKTHNAVITFVKKI
jgi:polysaccharide pyruvyl transferase WcaK-like protein